MDYQFWAALALIGLACCYLLTGAVRRWRRLRRGQCSSSCGCPSKPKVESTGLIEANDLTARLHQKRPI